MLLSKAKKVLADLVIDEALAHIPPRLRRSSIMNDQENHDEQADAAGGV